MGASGFKSFSNYIASQLARQADVKIQKVQPLAVMVPKILLNTTGISLVSAHLYAFPGRCLLSQDTSAPSPMAISPVLTFLLAVPPRFMADERSSAVMPYRAKLASLMMMRK